MFSKVFKKLDFLKDNRGIAPLFILVLVAAAALAIPLTTHTQKPNTGPQVAGTTTNAVGACFIPNPLCAFGYCLGPECLVGIGDLTGSVKDIAGKIGEVAKKAPDRLGDALSNVPIDKLGDVLQNVDSDTFKKIMDTGIDLSPLPLPDLAKLLLNKGADLTPGILSRIPLDKLKGAIDLMPTDKCTYVKGIQYLLIPSTFDILINQFCGSSNNPHPGESPTVTPTSNPTAPETTPTAPAPTSALYDCSSAPGDYLQYRCDAASEPPCEGEAGWQVSMHSPTSCSGSTPICCYSTKLGTAEPTSTPAPTTRPGTPTKAPPYSGGTPQPPQPPGPKATPTPAGKPCAGSDICGNAYGTNVPNYCTYKNNAENDTWCHNATNVAGVWCYSCSGGNPTILPTPSVTLDCPGSSASNNWATCGNAQFGGLGDCYNGNGSWSYKNEYSRDVWCKANAGSVKTYCYECHPNPNNPNIPPPGAPTPITPVPTFAACPTVNSDGSQNQCTTNSCTKAKPDGDSACQALYGNPSLKCCTVSNNLSPTCSTSNKQCLLSNSNPSNHASVDCTGCGGYCLNTGAPGLPSGYGQCMSLY